MGIVGNILLVTAYLPQISKIIKHKHADDLSLLMWINYLVGDFLLLVYSVYKNDAIVASLFTIMTIGNLSILFLTFKYGHVGIKKKPATAEAGVKDVKTDTELPKKEPKENPIHKDLPPVDKDEEKDHLHPPKL